MSNHDREILPIKITLYVPNAMSERRIQSAGLLLCLIYLELKNVEVYEFIELEITKMNKKLH